MRAKKDQPPTSIPRADIRVSLDSTTPTGSANMPKPVRRQIHISKRSKSMKPKGTPPTSPEKLCVTPVSHKKFSEQRFSQHIERGRERETWTLMTLSRTSRMQPRHHKASAQDIWPRSIVPRTNRADIARLVKPIKGRTRVLRIKEWHS